MNEQAATAATQEKTRAEWDIFDVVAHIFAKIIIFGIPSIVISDIHIIFKRLKDQAEGMEIDALAGLEFSEHTLKPHSIGLERMLTILEVYGHLLTMSHTRPPEYFFRGENRRMAQVFLVSSAPGKFSPDQIEVLDSLVEKFQQHLAEESKKGEAV